MSIMKLGRRGGRAAALVSALVLAGGLAACSSTGGAQASDGGSGGNGGGGSGEPKMTIAMVTHAPAGDTFFDIIRAGADAAAANDNVEYVYTNDGDVTAQATLIENAINQGVDGLAVSAPDTAALGGPIRDAVAAGIPVVMFNAGYNDWKDLGAFSYFGQDEALAGQSAGQRIAADNPGKVLCVIQAQGQSQLEARCDGVSQGLGSQVERLYVTGTDLPSTQSTISSALQSDPSITHVITLGAPIALAAAQAKSDAGSQAKVVTFDTNAELVDAIAAGDIEWAVDQQPYAQGYMAIHALSMWHDAGIALGGGLPVLTGPAFVDATNVESVSAFAKEGLR